MTFTDGRKIANKIVSKELTEVAPDFVRAVSKAKQSKADYLILSFKTFITEPDLFYLACNHASLEGVPVLIVPEHTSADWAVVVLCEFHKQLTLRLYYTLGHKIIIVIGVGRTEGTYFQ